MRIFSIFLILILWIVCTGSSFADTKKEEFGSSSIIEFKNYLPDIIFENGDEGRTRTIIVKTKSKKDGEFVKYFFQAMKVPLGDSTEFFCKDEVWTIAATVSSNSFLIGFRNAKSNTDIAIARKTSSINGDLISGRMVVNKREGGTFVMIASEENLEQFIANVKKIGLDSIKTK